MSNYSKGAKGENELGDLFSERGYVWTRTAGSGTGNRELPDQTFGKNGHLIVTETKRFGSDNYDYLSKEEVEDLIYFAENFGAEYYVAVRFDYGSWQFLKKEQMKETEKSYRVENIDDSEIKRTIDDVVE